MNGDARYIRDTFTKFLSNKLKRDRSEVQTPEAVKKDSIDERTTVTRSSDDKTVKESTKSAVAAEESEKRKSGPASIKKRRI